MSDSGRTCAECGCDPGHTRSCTTGEIKRLHEMIRSLRDVWFSYHLRSRAHDREWETDEQEKQRNQHNAKLREEYDAQTEMLLRGEGACLNPTCAHDLEKRRI